MSGSRILLLVRHAKSSWKDEDLRDIERPLNKRGLRDAPEMGRRLAERSLVPDLIVSSPAVRAATTAQLMAMAAEYDGDMIAIDDLYGASPHEVLEIAAHLPEQCQTVMMVGHNPTMTELAGLLGGSEIDNVPTCGVLTVEVESWSAVDQGRLLDFDYPKRL